MEATTPDWAQVLEDLRGRIGRETRPTVTEIEKGMIQRFAKAIGSTNPLYLDDEHARRSRFGRLVAPPTFVSYFIPDHIPADLIPTLPLDRDLHTDDIVRNYRPICEGDVITAFARYADAFQKQGKKGAMIFQMADVILTNQQSERVADVRVVTISY